MQQTSAKTQIPWLIIICGCIIALLAFGPRSAMGFFQLPMLADTGWDRTTFGLAMATQNLLWGFSQPVFGALADKYGAWRMLSLGALLYAAGLTMMAFPYSPAMLHVGGGVLVGVGVGACSFGIILAAFARNTAPEQRSLVFGFGTAAGSAGMFLFAPISQGLIEAVGWSDALIWISILMLTIPVLAIPLRGNAATSPVTTEEISQTAAEALREAFSHQSYLLLVAGFFVCGFHVAFISAHFPAYLSDVGIEAKYAVISIALIGFLNIFGSLASGILGQKYSKPLILVWLYLGRSIAITAFILVPPSPTSVVLFSMALGFLWLSTIAPTNALVAIMFGTRHLGMLGGLVFFSHQIGSFLGVWLGGYLYDKTGSYDPVWWIGIALGIFAAIVHWPIKERAVDRPAVAAA
ncbi:MAG: MFS transporter [Rhizobiaceae bacterium]